ncbi:DEAD/DEAH box helicase [Nocardiopsis exhalans]|uniref:DEAD/DEAH box helicase n=1 Tax=Nocardiopsis exhalans TaxID=163604 RepID=A0ABY5DER3_9ACTN|nr:DEAD/DEAH box helicase [Nocardiopsis exhalans]USY22507.1 DEAD/DEAH box helicase [Nocardiopsis exhalans]
MQPTLAAAEVRRNITQYLSTTFALADEPVREGLEYFFNDSTQGIFRGPYLRVRTPFRKSDDSWRSALEWHPPGFTPYLHQAKAFQRLSSLGKAPEPTLITTGTGSGKTESFLVPVLDHCRRARAQGKSGVKAILLYPMNALATDQAERLNKTLADPALSQVTAGLYIGDTPDTRYDHVATSRGEIRRIRPDILVTNYKMLDLLLQRSEDLPLWRDSELTYIVVDEFHTYDGAQGTDVAMLLRRLASATGNARPGYPLGDICPVATSATLGQDDPAPDSEGETVVEKSTPAHGIREVAATVFGTEFGPDSVVGEDRLSLEEFTGTTTNKYPVPNPVRVANLPDPHGNPKRMGPIMKAFTERDDLTPKQLGAVLRQHVLTRAVLKVLDGGVHSLDEVLDHLPEHGAEKWAAAMRGTPELTTEALARYVALLSLARDPDAPDPVDGRPARPLVTVETHLWVRSVSRLLRAVSNRASFTWHGETPVGRGAETTTGTLGRAHLPAVYCRHCGRSGWAAVSPESTPNDLETAPEKIYRTAVTAKRGLRPLMHATRQEAQESGADQTVWVLSSSGTHVRPVTQADIRAHDEQELDGVFVLTDIRHDAQAFRAAENDRCPVCDADQGTRFLGSGLAALASVAVTELFTGGQLSYGDDAHKTLLFNDSVQDAAHRAGFVSNRSYTFSARSLLASRLTTPDPEAPGGTRSTPKFLNDLIADTVLEAQRPSYLACVVPPDLHDQKGIDELLAGEDTGTGAQWEMVGERLAFTAVLEFGLRSRQGRTIELTRTATAHVRLEDPDRVAGLARDLLQHSAEALTGLPDPEVFRGYVRGLLDRIRTRGGIRHHWLDGWIQNAGTKRYGTIWGKRPDGMPAFPRPKRGISVPAPRFLLDRAKNGSEFDSIAGKGTWYQDWTTRCLGVPADAATRYLGRLLDLLYDEGVIDRFTTEDSTTRAYGLTPGHIRVTGIGNTDVARAGLICPVCNWRQTVLLDQQDDWRSARCPRYRCSGALQPDEDLRFRSDYYRRLYQHADPFRVTTAEHTGQLTRAQREHVERAFKKGERHTDPNVLSATPTLELGIDIGDLSAVILGSLPHGPANYIQRVGRAGRSTGNALLLTLVGRRAREQYYLQEPRDMIAGRIDPPGSFPSAMEILRRQYVAHLIDCAARDQLPGTPALPGRAADLFGDLGWLRGFTASALKIGPEQVERFLELFTGAGNDIDAPAAEQLRAFATGGIRHTLKRAEDAWDERLGDLRQRVAAVKEESDRLLDSDPEQKSRKRTLNAERAAVQRRIGEIGRTSAHGALVEYGVLPNYSLIDSAVELEATLTWDEESPDGGPARLFRSEVREYQRPARMALTEFAPGNHYYVQGFRHQIDGLDIGSRARQAYHPWRICPACGYVRTHNAESDTSPCPRCQNAFIGDRSCLHLVLEPTRVHARDRREDALIRDDHDDRRREFYQTAVTVDIPADRVEEGAWRHAGHAFGVEFTRDATVRRFNLGRSGGKRTAEVAFAGEQVAVNPFHVCRNCGGATPDEPLQAVSEMLSSQYDPRPSYHRPWCRQRRGDSVEHVPLLLAHTLRTEALRILLPVATVHTDERMVSFKAALMAGFARVYGGALDHLDAVVATMPDEATGHQRRYLVVYDTLPGGSGYLNPRKGADGIREVLAAAREVLTNCPCAEELTGRPACHRCLLAHVSDSEFPSADRGVALQMLADLLDDWRTDEVQHTGLISLWDQVESELEGRFLAGLERWAREGGTSRTFKREGSLDGRKKALLQLDTAQGVVSWDVILQNSFEKTRPDVVFRRRDSARQQVAVYLDGYRYHASPEKNRIADDAAKRAWLRAQGITVFQLTWDDVEVMEKGKDAAVYRKGTPVWEPYGTGGRERARKLFTGSDPKELERYTWVNPATTLFAYLTDPDDKAWAARAAALAIGMAGAQGVDGTMRPGADLAPRFTAILEGDEPLLPLVRRTDCQLVRGADGSGLRVVVIRQVPQNALSAFVLLDDEHATVVADTEAHKRRWKSWLYWGNWVQFLAVQGGDGAQLALSALGSFEAASLAAFGGYSLNDSVAEHPPTPEEIDELVGDTLVLSRTALPSVGVQTTRVEGTRVEGPPIAPTKVDRTKVDQTAAQAAGDSHAFDVTVDPEWVQALDWMEDQDPALTALAGELSRRGVTAPEVGYELPGSGMWVAELAWPDHGVAVVLPAEFHGSTDDRDRCVDAYVAAGWHVREAADWDVSELSAMLTTAASRPDDRPGRTEKEPKG